MSGAPRRAWQWATGSWLTAAGAGLLGAAVVAAGVTAGATRLSPSQTSAGLARAAATPATGVTARAGAGGRGAAGTVTAGTAGAGGNGATGTAGAAGNRTAGDGANAATGGAGNGAAGAGGNGTGTAAAGGGAAGAAGDTSSGDGAAVVGGLPTPPAPPPRTSCTSVVHIGDSTSDGLFSDDYLPNAADRMPARYADVGVRQTIERVVGGTSIVETLPGTQNAYQMASTLIRDGYHGCWVLALGTNDTADVYVGSNVGRVQRIQKMMALIGDQPVMWVEVVSILKSGPYSEQNMQAWNDALKQVAPQYPNMRIYNWPAVVQKPWFINDGIHYTSEGYKQRGIAIADALAGFFPAQG